MVGIFKRMAASANAIFLSEKCRFVLQRVWLHKVLIDAVFAVCDAAASCQYLVNIGL